MSEELKVEGLFCAIRTADGRVIRNKDGERIGTFAFRNEADGQRFLKQFEIEGTIEPLAGHETEGMYIAVWPTYVQKMAEN
ncbi:MAG: hypothetical protein ABSE28_20180 [Candidatus Sulfotelmatobacter sp.]